MRYLDQELLSRLEEGSIESPGRTGDSVVEETERQRDPDSKTERPPRYRVVLLNDDYTPMDFVVYVLEHFFHHSREDAIRIMLDVHTHGSGICGAFTREVAETKVLQVTDHARSEGHPLRCVMERE